MSLKLITAPTTEPITLTEAKLHCKVETDADDNLITALITAAREYCEGRQRRAYITQTWELWLDAFPDEPYIKLPRPPLVSVSSVKYYDINDSPTTISSGDYYVDSKSEPGWVSLNTGVSWPSTTLRPVNGVCITFVAGYGDAEDVPQMVKQAMLLIIGAWYDQRENFIASGAVPKEIPLGAQSLLWLDRSF